MARVSSYPIDNNPQKDDLLLGTDMDNAGGPTKNFLLGDISAAAISLYLANNSWKFTTDAIDGAMRKSSMFFATGGGDGTDWNNITSINVQTLMMNNSNSLPYLNYLLTDDPSDPKVKVQDNIITIFDRNDLGSFGIFELTGVTGVSNIIYQLQLIPLESSGTIQDAHQYGITLDPLNAQDKTIIFEQVTPNSTWTINHQLKKFPSVTVVDSANTVVQGSVLYKSQTQITLTFSAAFSGKAYLN